MLVSWLLLWLFAQCRSQIATPLTAFTQLSTVQMPSAFSQYQCGYDSVHNRIWLINGRKDNPQPDEVFYYDISSQTFANNPSHYLPFTITESISAQSYTQIGSILYFVYNNALQKFNLTSGSIIGNIPLLTTPNEAPCIVSTHHQYILIMGGENEATSPFTGFNYFEIYDIINLRWTIGQPLPRNRRYAACATISDYVYLYGGKNIYADASITDIDRIYIGNMTSIATQPWEPSVATMNGFNTNFAKAVVSNDLVYIMGGVNITDGRDGIIQVMDINANMYTISVKLNTYRSSPGVIIVNNVIYIFGGSTDIGNTDSFEYSNVLTFAPTNHPT
eukprot:490113_1